MPGRSPYQVVFPVTDLIQVRPAPIRIPSPRRKPVSSLRTSSTHAKRAPTASSRLQTVPAGAGLTRNVDKAGAAPGRPLRAIPGNRPGRFCFTSSQPLRWPRPRPNVKGCQCIYPSGSTTAATGKGTWSLTRRLIDSERGRHVRHLDPRFPQIIANYANQLPDGRQVKSTSIGIKDSRGR